MNISIRKASSTDTKDILRLINELAIFENEPDAVEITEKDLLENGFGKQPLFSCLVAEIDTHICGLALYYHRFSTWKGKSIHLEDLIVEEAYRGNGIGKKLYTEVMKDAYHQNVKRVEWAVLDWNKNAKDFYKNTGATIFDDWQIVQFNEENLKLFVEKQ